MHAHVGQFQPYSPDAQAALEEAFQRGLETATCVVHGHVYEVGPLRAAALVSGSASCQQSRLTQSGCEAQGGVNLALSNL